ncbi:Uncharacterised protein [Enterobacter cloacae]|nr:Uncharacterised protein [Enterobacter cloacae]
MVNRAEQQFVARRLPRGIRQQAGGGQVQMAFLALIQQGKGGFLHPIVGKSVLFLRQHNQLSGHRRMKRVADFRRRPPHHAAQHLQLARAAEAGDAAQQAARLVGHLLELFKHQRHHVLGVVPGADGLEIVMPFPLIFVVHHQSVIDDAAEKFLHEQRVAAGFFMDQRGKIGGTGTAGMKNPPEPARHGLHRQRLRHDRRGVLRRLRQARQRGLQGGLRKRTEIAVRHHHQQRDGAAGAQQVIERLQAGGVDPLHIIQQQHQRRALGGEGFHQRQHHMAEARPRVDGKGIRRETRFVLKE